MRLSLTGKPEMVFKVEEKCGLRQKVKKYGITEIF
jgi:hypothetical protein